MKRSAAALFAALFAASALAGPDDQAMQPAAQPSPGSVQTPAPPGLHPYYLVPFFPFLWPVPPAALAQPQSYPFVIWLPLQPPAPPAPVTAPPAAPSLPAVASPEPPAPPAPSVTAQEPSTAHTPTPAAPPEAAPPLVVADEPQPPVAEASQASAPSAEPARAGAPVRKPLAAKPAASPRPTPATKPAKRKLCWRNGRLDVCK
ncbi:MAG: hypothetical protein ACK4TK_05920 [Thiobacillaceae bacterium]